MKHDRIPLEKLFGNQEFTNPQISPNGEKLAYLAPYEQVLNIWSTPLDLDNFPLTAHDYMTVARVITQDRGSGIRHYMWAQDNRNLLYLQDSGGNEDWSLYRADSKTCEVQHLTPFHGVHVRMIGLSSVYPEEVLIAMNIEDPQAHDVYRLNIFTGKLKLIERNRQAVKQWIVDDELNIRGAVAALPDGGLNLLFRDNDAEKWNIALTWAAEDEMCSRPVSSLSKDGTTIYLVDSRGFSTGRLVKFNILNSKTQIIAEDPEYDVTDMMIHPDTFEIQAVAFYKERKEWRFFDPAVEKDFAVLKNSLQGDINILGRFKEDGLWLVEAVLDTAPVAYYVYDRTTGEIRFLFQRNQMGDYPLEKMEPISFQARDGLTLHGYITFPPGKPKKNLPMVLMIHGGPWARDHWGFRGETQWIANRGAICLQVNFRGSTGYGKHFVNAGNLEWGAKMHDDLVDAVHWCIAQGYADPQRVAIFGMSYGGYAALVGATFTPDLFCCTIEACGLSNLAAYVRRISPYWAPNLPSIKSRLGNPETDEAMLYSRSPIDKVQNLNKPILMAHGDNDVHVKRIQSDQMVQELKKNGVQYEYMTFPDEGHSFAKPGNRLAFFKKAEDFLVRYLDIGREQ